MHSFRVAGVVVAVFSVAIEAGLAQSVAVVDPADAATTILNTKPAPLPRIWSADDMKVLLADPAFRAEVGISENGYDFNVAGDAPGFGPIIRPEN